jgi:hypothetical protein
LLALFALAAKPAAEPAPTPFVHAAEFPYYLTPPSLWERDLVWLKSIGIQTVEFNIPADWHRVRSGEFDFTGRSNPRRDLVGFIRLLRRIGLEGWAKTEARIGSEGAAAANDAAKDAAARWNAALAALLAPQAASHGGPVRFVEPPLAGVDASGPPAPIQHIVATDPSALADSRGAIASGRGSLLWTSVTDAIYPAGWAPSGTPRLLDGVFSLNGEEHDPVALRRDALLLHAWTPLLGAMQPAPAPRPASSRFPEGVSAALLVSDAASAVSIVNRGVQPFQDDLRLTDPAARRSMVIPGVHVARGESLWLPVAVSLSQKSLCRECSNFSPIEQITYATAELLSIEYENGILAMEFSAPAPGIVVLQLERRPVGPFLAAGKPTEFEWDEKTLRARLPLPAGSGPAHRVRVGIAIEEPETSAFFDDAQRLIIGEKNTLSSTYSSPDVAARSRLRAPEAFSAQKMVKTPNQIDYEIAVPATAAEGDSAAFALEVDGMALGRARLDLFRPLNIRIAENVPLRYGARASLAADPPIIAIDPKGGTSVEATLANNWPAIQTYRIEAIGEGLDIFPARTEITIGAASERKINFRVFAAQGSPTEPILRKWRLHVTGAATLDFAARAVTVPRSGTVIWSADLDQDGSPEWILESAQARAIFSTQDGGRWIEFTWKDGGLNFLPENGALAGDGPVEMWVENGALQARCKDWTRTITLEGAVLTVQQSSPLLPETLTSAKRGNVSFMVSRQSASRVRYALGR